MRKIILLEHVSLDGFAAGRNGEMDWITFNDELQSDVHALHDTTDAAIYGRVTYQMMESYWPTVLTNPASTPPEINHATWLENATKIVFSKTLEKVNWQHSRLFKGNIVEEVNKIKQQPGKDIWMVGSLTVAQELMWHGLIDEYRINVNPVVLGGGVSLFGSLKDKLNLKLLGAKTYDCGVVALRYEAVKS